MVLHVRAELGPFASLSLDLLGVEMYVTFCSFQNRAQHCSPLSISPVPFTTEAWHIWGKGAWRKKITSLSERLVQSSICSLIHLSPPTTHTNTPKCELER
jgi:hypothetical protein